MMRPYILWYSSVFALFLLIFLHANLNAQNNQGNLGVGLGGGGGGGGDKLPEFRELLGLIMPSPGGLSRADRPTIRFGVISSLPSYINTIGVQHLPNYLQPNELTRMSYSASSQYINVNTARVYPLRIDPDDMELEDLNWFRFRGINGKKPIINTAISYDTESSSQNNVSDSFSLRQNIALSIPFTYGEEPNSSTMVNLQYRPSYLLDIVGDEDSELQHDILVQAGREFGRSAASLSNRTIISAAPQREISGRAKTIFNRTSLLAVYDVSPKSLVRSELGHTMTTRTGTSNSASQSIFIDDFNISYEFMLTPKISLNTSGGGSLTQVTNDEVTAEILGLNLNYAATAKLALNVTTGLQRRKSTTIPYELSEVYGLLINYVPGPKTIMRFGVDQSFRPSFADDGIILQENGIFLQIRQAVLLRWQVELLIDYITRTEAGQEDSKAALDQRDLGFELLFSYFLNDSWTLDFSAARYNLEDFRNNSSTTRFNLTVGMSHSF